ncbi:sensory box protein [Desulfovibrio sp. A2]|nr:sensory box protein [Desulfovibrio sp. A2]
MPRKTRPSPPPHRQRPAASGAMPTATPDAASGGGPGGGADARPSQTETQATGLHAGGSIPLFEHSVAPMLLIDPADGAIVDANPAACRFYGYPRERMAGMPISRINTLDGHELALRMNEAFCCDRSAFRFRHRTASGLVREVEVHSGPVWLNGRALLHSVVHDVSALHDSERRVERVQRLNDLRAALIRGGAPEEKLRLLAREIMTIFGAGACRIWLARQGDRCGQCPHAGSPCPTAARNAPTCLHLVVEEPPSPCCRPVPTERTEGVDGAEPDPRLARIPFRHGPVGRAASASTRRPVLHASPEADAPLSCDCGVFTAYAIRIGQGISGGVLGVHLPSLDPITDMQLEGLAHTAGHLLQAARTADATRRALRGLDSRIRKRTAQLRQANMLLRREVAERRRAELALRRSRDLLEHGERIGHLGSYWRDMETGRGQWSDNLFRMFGFPPAAESPSFARFFDRIHPGDRARVAGELHHALEARSTALVEYRYQGPSGLYRHARQQVTFDNAPRTGHKLPLAMHGMVQDVTEQRQRDELLRLQRDLLLALGITTTVEDCLGLCLRTALRAESVDAGAAWLRVDMTGTPRAPHLPDTPDTRVAPARHEWRLVAAQGFEPVVLARVRRLPMGIPATRLMEAGRPVPETPPEQESCCMLTGDAELDALAAASGVSCAHLLPVIHEGRAVACLLVGTRGPGAMRKAARHHVEAVAAQGGSAFARILQQQSLRESEANLRALLNAPRLSAFLLDPSGRVLACNATGAGRLGTTPDAMLGRTLEEYIPEELHRRRSDALASVVATATPATFRDTRGIHIFDHSLYPIADESGRVHRVAWLAEDVAHEVALERQLRQAQKMEAVGTLAGGIAHDFNNILGVIMSNIEMLRDTGLTGRAAARADRILRAALRAREVVRQLLAFGRPADEPYARLDLCRTVEDALHLVRPSIPASITLRTLLPASPLPVHGDATQIHQVLLNLCTNALHAMPDGGVLDVAVDTLDLGGDEVLRGYPELSPGRYVLLSVADSGLGMTAAQLERVFEPFFTTKPLGTGTGLGLSMVHGIARKHGGTVRAYSQPGQGARFDVLLPLLEPEASPPDDISPDVASPGAVPSRTVSPGDGPPVGGPQSHAQTGDASHAKPESPPTHPEPDVPSPALLPPLHVLVVDDEHDFRQSVAEMLHGIGHRATGTADAEEALRLLAAGRYDVALLDLRMPGISGPELARTIRARGHALPLVLCTGNEGDISAEELKETDMSLIGKPFTGEELSRRLRLLLEKA